MITPNQVENFLLKIEDRIIHFLGCYRRIPAAVLLVASLVLAHAALQLPPTRNVDLGLVLRSIPAMSVLLPVAFIAGFFFHLERSATLWAVLFTAAAAGFSLFLDRSCSSWSVISFPAFMLGCLGLVWLHRRGVMSVLVTLFSAVALYVAVGALNSEHFVGSACTVYFWGNKSQLYLAFLLGFLAQPKKEMELGLVMNPTHIAFARVFYFPFPESDLKHPALSSGIWKIAKGVALLTGILLLWKIFPSPPRSFRWVVLAHLNTMVSVMCLANYCVGVTEVCGIKCPVPTFFLPLARSPRDYFRRESTYAYLFSLQFIYFPLLRKFKTTILASLVFFLSFPFSRDGLQILFTSGNSPAWSHVLRIWGIWLFVFLLGDLPAFQSIFNRDKWRSVLITNLLMASPWISFWALGI